MSHDDHASGSATKAPPSDFQPPALRPPPITVYKARRPKKGFGWKRLLLWTLGTIIVAGVGIAGVTAWFVYDRLEKVTTISSGDTDLNKAATHLVLPKAGKPVTVLVLGYDHRSWEGKLPSRSDTMMLMRLDPQRKSLTTISIPRDMKIDLPGHGIQKINAAYSYGGANLALETVRRIFNLDINYLITVDFTGFRRIVDHVGGVYVDVERRYYNENGQPGSGDYTNIDIKAGYQKLRGGDALAYVRYRHDDSDIYRLARQQAFLRELKHRLDLTTVGTNFVSLVNDMADNVKIVSQKGHHPGPNTLIGYARALAEVPKSRTLQIKLEGDQGANSGGEFVDVGQTEITNDVQNFLAPDFNETAAAAKQVGGKTVGPGSGKKKAQPPISPKRLTVLTLNGSGVDFAAATAATALRNVGYPLTTVGTLDKTQTGNTLKQNYQTTMVYYTTKRARTAADKLRIALFDAKLGPAPPVYKHTKPAAQVVVIVGKNFDASSVKAATPPPSTTNTSAQAAPSVQAADSSVNGLFRYKQRLVHFPILIPKVVPRNTTYGEPDSSDGWLRHYKLHGGMALHATAYTTRNTGGTWDLQWTTWTTAPILDDPNQQAIVPKKGGRLWKLYLNGTNIHRIAVFYGSKRQYVVWIDNTLGDSLSNKTMVAVARSLSRVPAK
jgi:LCP family protein required for cell wall assembly